VYTFSRARTKIYTRYINISQGEREERDFTSLADYELGGNKPILSSILEPSPSLPWIRFYRKRSHFCDKNITGQLPPKFSQIVGCKHKTILEGRNLFEREIAIVSLYQGLAIERQVRAQRTIIESRYYTRTHAYVMIHPAVFYPTARARFLTPTRCV